MFVSWASYNAVWPSYFLVVDFKLKLLILINACVYLVFDCCVTALQFQSCCEGTLNPKKIIKGKIKKFKKKKKK